MQPICLTNICLLLGLIKLTIANFLAIYINLDVHNSTLHEHYIIDEYNDFQ
jgi:hypothetical protein